MHLVAVRFSDKYVMTKILRAKTQEYGCSEHNKIVGKTRLFRYKYGRLQKVVLSNQFHGFFLVFFLVIRKLIFYNVRKMQDWKGKFLSWFVDLLTLTLRKFWVLFHFFYQRTFSILNHSSSPKSAVMLLWVGMVNGCWWMLHVSPVRKISYNILLLFLWVKD